MISNLERIRQIANKEVDRITPQDALDGFRIFGDICTAMIEAGELIWKNETIQVPPSNVPAPIPDDEALTAELPIRGPIIHADGCPNRRHYRAMPGCFNSCK